jgi:hypothetical protein
VYDIGWGVWSRRKLFNDHTLYIATQIVINILINKKRQLLTVLINLIFQNELKTTDQNKKSSDPRSVTREMKKEDQSVR